MLFYRPQYGIYARGQGPQTFRENAGNCKGLYPDVYPVFGKFYTLEFSFPYQGTQKPSPAPYRRENKNSERPHDYPEGNMK
jgi:hypothetical protein